MGLLDDAIREHLDLKRRRGADPAEVERAEREALGPVRRGPDPAAEADSQVGLPYDDEADEEWEESFEEPFADSLETGGSPEPLASTKPPSVRRPPASEGDPVHDDDGPPPRSHGAETVEDDGEEPVGGPPPHGAPGSAPAPAAGEETVEFRVEDAASREGEEDVLEETPEFLQDTPDHDRLWFEQRPPRDFDFEG